MQQLLYVLPALACPVGMGAMMWFMMRPEHGTRPDPGSDRQELVRLRKEIDALRTERGPRTDVQDHPA
ncbi:hypothetical protein [Streptomyces sp. MBT62]|uniref:hypothetical protein n=1 Tax=Streptomyces sp. MBT62 TaxID=2800410 RepID=UPI00190BCD72|nr:hypothetical protein [Streptomyces sp. MBT62]MBK3570957.1 hypothetical protein [Streptomyces sp. MBT62]